MEEPKIEEVLRYVYDLYENPDTSSKESASKWLAELQKSIFSWKISDQLLQQKNDLHSCYFAANTLRTKIQHSFHELPETAHISLRDSIIQHIEHVTIDTNPIITKQLCLALSNLILLMGTWQKPIESLLEKFASSTDSIQPLIITLTFIPEEIEARYLRLGDNRRKQVLKDLELSSPVVLNFLQNCLESPATQRMHLDIIACFTSWVKMKCITLPDAASAAVFSHAFQILMNPAASTEKQLDIASDCVCAVLESMDLEKTTPDIEETIFNGIMQLERAYQDSVAHEDADKSMVLCRVFTVVAETYLPRMINNSSPKAPHYSVKSLDSLIMCVGHFDFEVAQITFNVWYKLSEDLYQKNNDDLTKIFENHIERLIEALYKHCQLDADHEGLIDDENSFSDFRYKVSELIKDVIFIIKSISCFEQMFRMLREPNVTWESTEAALFIMSCIARNIYTEEDNIVPQVVDAIINLPENCHIAIRYTSVTILGQLCDWIAVHPVKLEAILNFLSAALQKKAAVASAAAQSLQLICSSCHRDMIHHISGLITIAQCLEEFEVQPEAATVLLKGISAIVSRLPNGQITDVMRQLCGFQIAHICKLIESGEKKDPSQWIDRLASIYRHMNPRVGQNEVNPTTIVIIENWPVLSKSLEFYQKDDKIVERIVRCIRYAIRCISSQALPILEPLVKQMVETYAVQQHSCLLYLGSILVDEFGHDCRCIEGLLKMLEAFIQPTFLLLQVDNGLKDHPDTVDDFFRLAVRFIQRMPLQFLQNSPIVSSIVQCATLACSLDHRDANMSVMKFLSNLLAHGKPNGDPEIKPFVHQIVQSNGDRLISNLLHSSIFCLHPNMLGDVTDVFMEIKFIDNEVFGEALKNSLILLPRTNAGGSVTATDAQMTEFYQSLTKANVSTRQMTYALQDFCRLFR